MSDPHARATTGGDTKDFFLSYATPDRSWAEWIANTLELSGYSVELDLWDWHAGQSFVAQMEHSLEGAERIITLWSRKYFVGRFSRPEFYSAFTSNTADSLRLLPVMIEECQIPNLYNNIIYVNLVGLEEGPAILQLLEGVKSQTKRRAIPFPAEKSVTFSQRAPFPGRLPTVWNIPSKNPHFTNRGPLLERIRSRLTSEKKGQAVQVLYGLGGVGKTQLAVEYAWRHTEEYQVVWWVEAEQPSLIAEQIANLGERLNLPFVGGVTRSAAVMDILRQRPGWLIIYDNVQDYEDIRDWLPGELGHVLITSRSPVWGGLAGRIEVEVFKRSDTIKLLQRRILRLSASTAESLAEEVGDLPLAAAQVAAYIETTAIPPDRYLDKFQARHNEMIAKGRDLAYGGGVDTAWSLALEQLQENDPAAAELLDLAAFFGPEKIPLSFFSSNPDIVSSALRNRIFGQDSKDLDDTLGTLIGLSLARRRDASIQVHRLVQSVIRVHGRTENKEEAAAKVRALILASAPGRPDEPETWLAWSSLVPHLMTAPALKMHRTDEKIRNLILEAAWYLYRRSDYQAIIDLTAGLHQDLIEEVGRDHPDTLLAANNLAGALLALGNTEAARDLDRATYESYRRTLGHDHLDTVWAANGLGFTLNCLGEHEEALGLYTHTWEVRISKLGKGHVYTLIAANGVALSLSALGDDAAARAIYEKIYAVQHGPDGLGPDHQDSLWTAVGLAASLNALGEYDKALDLYRDALDSQQRTLGAEHPDTLITEQGISYVVRNKGQKGLADEIARQVKERKARLYGRHPDTPLPMGGIGETFDKIQRRRATGSSPQ